MDSPERLPVVFSDIVLNAMGKYFHKDILAVLTFSGRIDADQLGRAIRLTLDAEPVLGCRFVPDRRRAYWERCSHLDEVDLCPVEETADLDGATGQFAVTPLDHSQGPCIRALLLRGEQDRLCLKIDHTASDAGGLKDYIYLLADTYSRLGREPSFAPETGSLESRSHGQVISRLGLLGKMRVFWDMVRMQLAWNFPRRYWQVPFSGTEPAFARRVLPPEEMAHLHKARRRLGLTVNDALVGAAFWAFRKTISPGPGTPLRLVTTADMRRHLPQDRRRVICNLSGFAYMCMGTELGESVAHTAARVHERMEYLKAHHVGVHDYVGMAPLIAKVCSFARTKKMFRKLIDGAISRGLVPMGLTNMGQLDRQRLDFGGLAIDDAFLAPPVAHPPSFVFGVTGFGGSLSLTVGYHQGRSGPRPVEDFFDAYEGYLLSL